MSHSFRYGQKKLEEELNLIRRYELVGHEAMTPIKVNTFDEAFTTEISSDEMDIFERKKNFEEITRRLESVREDSLYKMRGSNY